jgi:VWFA-related protein
VLIIPAALWLILAQQPEPQPAFKSGINLVEVDVVVTDKHGRPVRGLRQQDFEVLEDGKPVSVVTFVAVDLPQAPPDATIPPLDRSGSSVATNDQPEDGRVMLIVLDDHHVRFDAGFLVRTKTIARRLVERLGPSDQAAVIATSGRSIMQAEFTGDKARLVAAIDKFFPQGDPASIDTVGSMMNRGLGTPAAGRFGFEKEIKTRWAMDALSNAARALAQIPHRRKAILLVSEGLPVGVEEIVTNLNASTAWQSLRDFIVTAQRHNVAVYTVDPCGLSLECSTDAQQNLRTLAENTGGFAVVNTNAPEESVERIVAENGTYYLLGYASPALPNDGRPHRITVRTREPGVDLRAREGYVSPRRSSRAPAAASPVDQLIGAPIQTRGLTMRVAAVPAPLASSPGSGIVVAIELAAKDALEATRIDFSVLAIDADGKVRARQRFANDFKATGSGASGPVRLRTHLGVPPGQYQIRVAGVAANKTYGSVFTEVTVPKFDSELALGGLSLVSPTPGVAVNAKQMSEVVGLTPFAGRDVPPNAPIAAEVPIRVSMKAASTPLTMTATLIRPGGDARQLDQTAHAASDYAKPSGHVYRIALPPDLAEGDYRLVVEAMSGRARATRELAFRVGAPEIR